LNWKPVAITFAIIAAIVLALGLFSASVLAGETDCTTWLASDHPTWKGADAKYTLPSGKRPDLVTPSLAIEVERCTRPKWYEAIGQSLCYAIEIADAEPGKDRRPAIILLRTAATADDAVEIAVIKDCQRVCDRVGILLFVVTPPVELLSR
jgi:hypothetical protein